MKKRSFPLFRRGRGTSGGYAGRATATTSGRSPAMWAYSAINMRTKRGCGMNPPSVRRRLFPNMISPGVCSACGMERRGVLPGAELKRKAAGTWFKKEKQKKRICEV